MCVYTLKCTTAELTLPATIHLVYVLLLYNVWYTTYSLLNQLWSGKEKHMISPYFQNIYQLSVAEKEIIRGIYTIILRMLSFFSIQPFIYS